MITKSWRWSFRHPPEVIWPILADTARFNEASGLPRHEITEVAGPDGAVSFYGAAKIGPFRLRWQDLPVNWVSGQFLGHIRLFSRGPLDYLGAHLVFAADPETGGSVGTYILNARARGLFGRLMLATQFFTRAGATFSRLAAEAEAYVNGERATPFTYRAPQPDAATRARVARLVGEIEATPHGHGLAQRLADHLLTAQEVDLWKVRPRALARQWQAPERHAIELCLQAVKSGMLELRWDLLCPRCRIAKAWAGGLDHLPTGAHCPSCNITYDRDFTKNVEASFRPSPALRAVESGEYCMWGPMSVPHVKAQIHLLPGESRDIPALLEEGPYRLRTLEPGGECEIQHDGQAFPALIIDGDAIMAGPTAGPGLLRFQNRSSRPRVAVIESRHWIADCLTADRITALQAFRDLFSEDVLRPGDEVAIGRVTLLFSDLRASTALYERIGDAAAYHLVREHFAFMTEIVRRHDGAVVKTIGDAVMAAFARPQDGLAAALDIQRGIAAWNAGQQTARKESGAMPVVIKLGLHQGPGIVVTLNDRLDYFGSTVNMAARLQGQSGGGEIVLSREMAEDPATAPLLAGLALRPDRVQLKGFDRSTDFYRLSP